MLRYVLYLMLFAGLVGCRSEVAELSPSDGQQPSTAAPTQNHFRFVDISDALGIDFQYHNDEQQEKYAILESIGGGVAVWDYDLNGLSDLIFPGGGKFQGENQLAGLPAALFSQMARGEFINQSLPAGLASAPFYSHGCAVGDYDNDGFPDLVVTGYGGITCWHNQGDGTFEEVADVSGLVDPSWSTSAGWGDLNGDGALDLYLAHYVDWSFDNDPFCSDGPGKRDVCPPRQFVGLDDRVFYSNGDGTFRDASQEAGLVEQGKGLGVVLGDVDGDLDLDIYVANDTTNNVLYLNDGKGKLQEAGLARGVAVDDQAVANGSMGVDIGDFNADGQPDLWVANYEAEAFAIYKNIGKGQFLYASRETGVSDIGNLFVGFGTQFADLDADGDEDIIVSNGHVIHFPKHTTVRQLPLLLENEAGHFRRLLFDETGYLGTLHYGRGVVADDLDQDGDLDLIFANCNERAAVLENQTQADPEWLKVRLVGRVSNRDGIGARLTLHTSNGDQSQFVTGGGSYLSQGSYLVYFGLPAGTEIIGLTIDWPSGTTQTVSKLVPNQQITMVE